MPVYGDGVVMKEGSGEARKAMSLDGVVQGAESTGLDRRRVACRKVGAEVAVTREMGSAAGSKRQAAAKTDGTKTDQRVSVMEDWMKGGKESCEGERAELPPNATGARAWAICALLPNAVAIATCMMVLRTDIIVSQYKRQRRLSNRRLDVLSWAKQGGPVHRHSRFLLGHRP